MCHRHRRRLADDSSNLAASAGVSKKVFSNHLPLIRHETFSHVIDTLRVGRQHLRRKLAEAEDSLQHFGGNVALFPKSSKASPKSDKAATKSAKAYSKGEKVSSSTSTSTCQTKLDACEAEADTVPHWLFVQMADMCTLYRDEDGIYHLESSNFHKDTEWFTDRPMQLEKTEPTSDWFNSFNGQFDDGKGMPNAALTIVDDDASKDVVVSVFAEAYIKEGEEGDEGVTTYGYKLEQSTDQESVMALEALMDGEDNVTFDHCSMFIDMKIAEGKLGPNLFF